MDDGDPKASPDAEPPRMRPVTPTHLASLVEGEALLRIDGLHAGHGATEVLHGVDLRLGTGQSLCVIGPNGAGKSTLLLAVAGLCNATAGSIALGGTDIMRLAPHERLARAGVACVLQDSSVFPDMTVEENMWMGGYLMASPARAREAAERIFDDHPQLAARRRQPARVLSGGERRMLEIARALMTRPRLLLLDEPLIGLSPAMIERVFRLLDDLQRRESKTIVMVEQNARRGLEWADIGYLMVGGRIMMAERAATMAALPDLGRLFLGDPHAASRARPGQ